MRRIRAAYTGYAVGLRGDLLEPADLQQRRGDRDPAPRDLRHVVRGEAGAVLEAVDAGREQPGDGLGGEGVRRDACAVVVRDGDRAARSVVGPQRAQVAVGAEVAVDPVGDELDPAVAARGLLADGGGQVGGVGQLEAVVPQVALGPGQVRARAQQAGQVVALVDPRVSAGEPASRTSSMPASRSASACASAVVRSTAPSGPSPMWQCTSTRPGSGPALDRA